ncbi:MAG: hypothetical protein JNL80_15805 [Phycisphaerae bacterium]|jgi:streptogramin lyase|nr:hypothetical protein [Phycisphaerae bacterium]
MTHWKTLAIAVAAMVTTTDLAHAEESFSWRYYRLGNTGIQGDWNESIFIDSDGNPWIGGYDPGFEEGGIAKFIQAENRWINVSNVDYPIIGHPEEQGCVRVSDMISDGQGNLWMGTWRGVMRMNLAAGPSSLVRWAPGDSALPGGLTRDMTQAPDGTIWVSAESTDWAAGGLSRFNPSTGTWTHIPNHGGGKIAAQPKPRGGYYLWTANGGSSGMSRWDSSTGIWKNYPMASGQPAALVSLDSADADGNVWMMRWIGNQGQQQLDCIRPNGTWVSPPLPPQNPVVPVAALRAFGSMQCLMIDGFAVLHRFDGTSWTDLGPVPTSGFIDDMDMDSAGNVWVCGSSQGGAIRRDAETGEWQRYRITNTSQIDNFSSDLSIDPVTGDVYACANTSAGVGGMERFDGVRWTGHNQLTYGLGFDWPFDTDNSESVCVRPSTGGVVANPTSHFTFEFDGSSWASIPGGPDQISQYVEDSLGRLWGVAHYGGLGFYSPSGFNQVSAGGWGIRLEVDPVRAGTVWANEDLTLTRTDGVSTLQWTTESFPELTFQSPYINGLAIDANGSAWVGCQLLNESGQPGGGLLHIDPTTGSHTVDTLFEGWPFPGDYVYPMCVSPDGKLWMYYEGGEFPDYQFGLCWWDGTNVGSFPAPTGGEPQWGGLPHASIKDLELKVIPGGYELWMSCLSRGIAVLSVTSTTTPGDLNGDGVVSAADLSILLGAWGSCSGACEADLNGDGNVNAADLAALLGAWS